MIDFLTNLKNPIFLRLFFLSSLFHLVFFDFLQVSHFSLGPLSWCQDDSSLPRLSILIGYLVIGGLIENHAANSNSSELDTNH